VPETAAASLRRIDPSGSGHRCAFVVLLLFLVAASSAAAAPGHHARRPATKVDPGVLWSQFPLAQTRAPKGAATNAPRLEIVPRTSRPKRPVTVAHHGHRRRDVVAAIVLGTMLMLVLAVAGARVRRRSTRSHERTYANALTAQPLPDGPSIEAQPTAPASDGAPETGHLVFVPTDDGYTLLERPGEPPLVPRELDGSELGLVGRFRISRVVASPLPGDERDCVYLERV
jgi:hypothetical protein